VAAPEPVEAATEETRGATAGAAAPGARRSARSAVLAYIRWLAGIVVLVLLIRTFVGEATIIPTASMEQTILVGDHIFLNKLLYGPQIPFTSWRLPAVRQVQGQDIVAFRFPPDPSLIYVKRVIGLPGDRVEVRGHRVLVNGQRLQEPYAVHTHPRRRENYGPTTVPAGHLFVMGDNRDNSHDSRFWGPVPLENVIGKPVLVYWSYEAPTDDWLQEGFLNRARFYAAVAMNFFSKTRWARIGLLF
jgi:signal peptidase I